MRMTKTIKLTKPARHAWGTGCHDTILVDVQAENTAPNIATNLLVPGRIL
jgi:hypothetical protein